MDEPYYGSAEPLVPRVGSLEAVRDAATTCRACHLWRCGTQTVFGAGPPRARLMLVGEQPGDREDVQGKPFVGPAGRLLEACLREAGMTPEDTYQTNAVKHFKWEPRGGRRIHKKPSYREVAACYPWLRREIELVEPEVVVCLGATAAQALLGKDFKVTEQRGRFLMGSGGRPYLATVHPSSILRARDSEARAAERQRFVDDLRLVAKYLEADIASRVSFR